MPRYLISYDVVSAQARQKISGRLEYAGRRVQKSVFMVKCSENNFMKLVQDLQSFLGVQDSLLCLPCCEECYAKAVISAELPPLMFFK